MRLLANLWEGWKRLGKRIGDFQARLLLTVFYFVILAPFALAVRWAGDPLSLKHRGDSWHPTLDPDSPRLDRARNQF
jgi:hypothetical protein